MEDSVERETAGARMRVEDAEAAVQQEQDNRTHAELAGLTSRKPKQTFEEMLIAIGDSLSNLASANDGEDWEDEEDEETEKGKLSEDDEPGWVMGTITKTVQTAHGEVLAEADEVRRIDSTVMGGCSQLLP